ncbi:MAG: phage terminase large subunit [Pseudomonadota bacterium]|nr:phage terminase large subunit [Pseudomonadota bacterium]
MDDNTKIKRIKSDFRIFLWLVWRHLDLPTPSDLQLDIAGYLQSGPKRRMVQAFRGIGKSWLTAAYVLWRLYVNPNERILVVSASKDRSEAFSVFVKRLIEEMPLLHHLRPDPDKGQRDSVLAFDVGPSAAHQAPSVRSVGITGQLTGGRATIIVADDVEVPKNSLTQTMRDRLAESVKEFKS